MLGIWIVITIAGAAIIFIGFLFIFQSHYVYYPERVLSADPGGIGLLQHDEDLVTDRIVMELCHSGEEKAKLVAVLDALNAGLQLLHDGINLLLSCLHFHCRQDCHEAILR